MRRPKSAVLIALVLPNATALAIAAAIGLSGCSIPDSQFEAVDGGGELPGGPTLTIVASATALEVTESGEAELMVSLSQAPTAPIKVSVATLSTKIALSAPELSFSPETFAQPQKLTVTALPDPDTVAERAEITLSAPEVSAVTVGASIADDDTLLIATNIGGGGMVTVNEGGSATVRVHLTAQPQTDVRVDALLAAGPISITGPSSRIFTKDNYDVDQTFTFAASDDANITPEDVALTLRATDVPDKLATLRTVDDDTLNILINPSTLEVTEDGAAGTIDVSLTQQPAADVTVTITSATGQTSLSAASFVFTTANYNRVQKLSVTGRDDNDTAPGTDTIRFNAPTLTERTTAVTILDPDVQQLLVDAANPLLVTEGGETTFSATLRYRPAADVVVTVSSLNTNVATAIAPNGVLRFRPTDYNVAHPVTVRGTEDNNLAPNSTSIRLAETDLGNRDVPVSVSDNDTQRFIVTETALTIPEGTTKTFDVSLAYEPGGTVTGTVASSNGVALPATPASLSFNNATYNQPVRVTVSATLDANNVSETATITMSGCGAATAATVAATAMERTQLRQYGWPTPFSATTAIAQGTVIAYKVKVEDSSSLDSFGIFVPAAVGDYRMALYANVGNLPTNLVAQMPVRRPLANGSTTADITPDVQVPVGDYWLVLRVGQQTAVGYSPVDVTGTRCIRQVDIPNLDDAWPSTFGQASCGTGRLLNLWINNYFQQ